MKKKIIVTSVMRPSYYCTQEQLVQETIFVPENDLEMKPLSHIKKVNKYNKNFIR